MSHDRQPPESFEVTAEPPESPVTLAGTDHVTLVGSNTEDTVAFYRDLLGMSLVLRQPNLDDPDATHLFFDTGDGRILTFFVEEDRDSDPQPHRHRVGSVHHVSFSVEPERFVETREALSEAGHGVDDFDRGIFRSLYTRDHNGLVIELSTDLYDVPDERRGEVLAATQRIREADGADYAQKEHLERALEELGVDADPEPYDLPDAPTGTGVD